MDNLLITIAETLVAQGNIEEILALDTGAMDIFVLREFGEDLGCWALRRIHTALCNWVNAGRTANLWDTLVVAPLSLSGLEALRAL